MGDPNLNIPTEKINPDLHIIQTTKEGNMRYAITFSTMDEASYYRNWIIQIPKIEERLRILEEKFANCPNCSG